jgi:CRP-like cAMP-binding protein
VLSQLKSISTYREFNANVQLEKSGKKPKKLYFLVSGVMRCYITSEKGKEFNKRFFFSQDFVGALTALIRKEPSQMVYETLTKVSLYEIDYKRLMELCNTNIVISNFYAKALEIVFMTYEKRQIDLISLNSSQRYLKLIKDMPNIDKLIPQYHLASYLNITPVQLSRIKKHLKLNP